LTTGEEKQRLQERRMAEEAKDTASYMHTEHLYTVIIEVFETQEVFIQQVRTAETKPGDVFFAWVKQAVTRGFIKGTEDPQIPFRDITVSENTLESLVEQGFVKGADDPKIPFHDITKRHKHPEPLTGVFNVWEITFSIGKDFYTKDTIRARYDGMFNFRESIHCTVYFIKTAPAASSRELAPERALDASDSRLVRRAEEKYAAYLERYVRLKGVSELTKSINQERKRVEKQLLYWDAKRGFLRRGCNRDAKAEEEYLYTVTFDYEYYRDWGTWIYQDTRRGTDINYVCHAWVCRLLYDTCKPNADSEDRKQMITDQDRMLLMEKICLGHYAPTPVTGLTNVWNTYFSLSAGMAKLTIIKTARDEVVQG
jgi:hypothetical protein